MKDLFEAVHLVNHVIVEEQLLRRPDVADGIGVTRFRLGCECSYGAKQQDGNQTDQSRLKKAATSAN